MVCGYFNIEIHLTKLQNVSFRLKLKQHYKEKSSNFIIASKLINLYFDRKCFKGVGVPLSGNSFDEAPECFISILSCKKNVVLTFHLLLMHVLIYINWLVSSLCDFIIGLGLQKDYCRGSQCHP